MKEPIPFLLKSLLRKCDVNVDFQELEFQLLSHPTYPSLHAVTGVLDHFAIKNIALEVPKNDDSIAILPNYFLARVEDQSVERFVLVRKKQVGFELTFQQNRKETLTVNQFLEIWTGLIAVVEKDEFDLTPKTNNDFIKNGILWLAIIATVSLPFLFNPSLIQTTHVILSIVGLAFSVLIIQHELGVSSAILTKFCSAGNADVSCEGVLNSKGGTFLGLIKLSDLGLIYFSGLLLSWLLITLGSASHNAIILLSVFPVPLTFYSIYYQYRVVKKWCILCLSVMAVLWIQAALVILSDIQRSSLDIKPISLIVLSFLSITAAWQFIAPKLRNELELKKLKMSHFKFKRKYSLFKALITQSAAINTVIKKDEIILGHKSKHPPLTIMIVTNPSCGHCKDAHRLVEPLLKQYAGQITICIRFNVNTTRPDDPSVKVSARLLEIYHTQGEQICLQALHDIYGEMAADEWLHQWHAHRDPSYLEILKAENEWCLDNKIDFTPEILVNGLSFPNEYDLSDLLYFIDDLLDDARLHAEKTPSLMEVTA